MSVISKTVLVTGAVLTALIASPTRAQQNSGQLFHCLNDQRTWTLYESSSARMFHQEIGIMGPGTFTLSMTANGFGFEGFSYTRSSAWDKWQYVTKTSKGKRSWSQTWRMTDGDTRLGLFQLIKGSNACPNCTITMRMSTSQCQTRKPDPYSQPCPVNQCLTRQSLYGITGGRCISKPGWNGSACR